MSRIKNLVRRNSNIPRWVPAAMVVAAAIALLFFRGDLPSASSQSGNYHDDDSAERGERRDGSGRSDERDMGSGVTREERDEEEGGTGEGSGREDGSDEDDDYVVLTEEEIGPAIRSACSSSDFQYYCKTVREGWDLLHPDRLESTCTRMYEIFRREDPVAAALFQEHLTWAEQHRTFTIMMTTIISKSADPCNLEKTLRPLGERHFVRGVKDSYYGSLGKALVQAVGEALGREAFPPSAAFAWEGFFATVSGCMMIAGDGVAPRRQRVDVAMGEGINIGGSRKDHPQGSPVMSVGWERGHDGTLSYGVVRSQHNSHFPVIAEEPDVYLKHVVETVESVGGGGILSS